MKPPAARALRIGLTDPKGPLARQIRDAFHGSPVPVSRFVPLAAATEDGNLSEIDGEAEFLRSPSRESIGDLDLLILGGSPVDPECRVFASEGKIPTFDVAEFPPAAEGCAAVISALAPPPASAAFTILLPASEAGTPGIEELFEQAGASLNFRPAESSVFGARLAFNVFRDTGAEALAAAARASLERRFPACRISVLCARVAVFHGYAASARLRFASEAEARAALRQLQSSTEISVGGAPGGASTAAAVEEERILVDPPLVEDDAATLWIAFDGLALAARAALRAATRLLG